VIPNEAVEAATKVVWEMADALQSHEYAAEIARLALEAAAPHLMAQALREAAADAKDPSARDMDAYHIDQADVWLWLQTRAIDVEAGTHGND
jgi:hypothetical protein